MASASRSVGSSSTMDWKKLFSANEELSLQFFPPLSKDGEVSVTLPLDVFDDGIKCWMNSVVVQFLGKPLPFNVFKSLATNLWGKKCEIEVRIVGVSTFLVQFSSRTMMDWVLEQGPWHFHNQPVIIRKWEPNIQNLEFNLSTLPVWIHLSRIPLEFFIRIGLSYIASAIGVPLYMDSITASRQRVAFAKVCVELPADAIIPKFVKSCPHNATAGGLCKKGAKVEDMVQEAVVGVVLGEAALDLTGFEGVNFARGDPSREVLAGPEGVVLGPAVGAGDIEVVSEVRDKSNGVSSRGGDPSRGILAGAEGVVQGPAVRAKANEVVSENRAEIVLGDATQGAVLLNSVGKDAASGEDVDIPGCKEVIEQKAQRVATQGVATVVQNMKNCVCLIETRVKVGNVVSLWQKLFPHWQGVHNYSEAINGRLWVLWRNSIQFSVIDITDQCITGVVKTGVEEFVLSAVYDCNLGTDRRRLWDHLVGLQSIVGQRPWMIMGDFNVTLCQDESSEVGVDLVEIWRTLKSV
ncbi:hypothetical protein V6N13_132705 [Hibiscus sabdariffa]